MGTRRVWIALLVAAVLQYPRVHAATKCQQCPPVLQTANCDLNAGCIKKANQALVPSLSAPPACNILTCPDGGFFMTNLPDLSDPAIEEIKCNDNSVWTYDGKEIDKAVCVEKFLCTKKNPRTLILSCTASLAPSIQTTIKCKELTFADSGKIKCSGQTMFYKKSGASVWSQRDDVSCHDDTGRWETDKAEEVATADFVICADSNPDTVAALADCTEATKALRSGCPASPPAVECEQAPFSPDATLVCPGSKNHYVENPAGTWTPASDIKCDQSNGVWKEGTTGANVLPPGTNVVCAKDDPTPSCQKSVPLRADCSDASIDPTAGCDDTAPVVGDDSTKTCAQGKQLYYYDGSRWQAVKDNQISCQLTTSKWQQGTTAMIDLTGDKVICAGSDPNPPPAGACPRLDTSCDAGWDTAFGCETLQTPVVTPACNPTKNLYFRKDSLSGQTVKFQKVTTVDCPGKKVTYAYGLTPVTEAIDDNDKLICATENPQNDVCIVGKIPGTDEVNYKVDNGNNIKYEAGAEVNCNDRADYEYISIDMETTALTISLPNGLKPVCQQDGTWKLGVDINMGNKIMCRIKKCKMCQLTNIPLPDPTPTSNLMMKTGDFTVNVGECGVLECTSEQRMVVKTTDDIVKYFGRKPVCAEDGQSWKDDENNVLMQAMCVQQLFCHDTVTPVIDVTCPAGMEDCEAIALPAPDSMIGAHLPLTCNSKKIFIKSNVAPDDQYWDELKSIQCDINTGKWKIVIEGKTLPQGEVEKQRDHKNTLICRGENPKPRPAPTPPTIEPICTLCKSQLPAFLECDACSKNGTAGEKDYKFESSNSRAPTLSDKCFMKPAVGSKIVINNFEEKDSIECNRTKPDKRPNEIEWHTREGTKVSKFSARKEAPDSKWKIMSYVIVGIAFISIGGMGIGCFVIYFRMRKQPSSREKKKKERGVTKKYTSSNVVKTNQSNRSKEACKSKEPTGSKMDDQFEEAPTLKL